MRAAGFIPAVLDAYIPRKFACIPLGIRVIANPRRVNRDEQIRLPVWRVGCNQRCHERWRLARTPCRPASRPARDTAVPLVAVYRGPASASLCAGFEESCRFWDRATVLAPMPA